MLKADTEHKQELPDVLRKYICDIIEYCKNDLTGFEDSLRAYKGESLNCSAKWAVSGRKKAEKIHKAIAAHKGALSLATETIALHITHGIKSDTATISKDICLIKGSTANLAKQLEKQDEILKQIAWLRAVVPKMAFVNDDKSFMMDKYLDRLTDYAGSACGDSVPEDVANEMNLLSLDDSGSRTSTSESVSSTPFLQASESMTLVMGNTHRLVTPQEPTPRNKHMWTFYIHVSEPEKIEEVRIYLHPTFVPSMLLFKNLPFSASRIGWGYFTITTIIKLKEGYFWRAIESEYLTLQWELDFNEYGSSFSYNVEVTDTKNSSPIDLKP
ncbi:uncharacterized protein N7469_005105 [Penicillium citrinum]|uniref:YEATS domain-containing protein n=1 Tax=Penicillium citrinum TaxID=5077 RepID=A0A9W9P0X3_PENCI|nr:uncharacterized protein N7469_005105 [Penicillium citrinum]KAJ5233339.1 hypothetical protein N7469_005105 [Penicillium citrinum]